MSEDQILIEIYREKKNKIEKRLDTFRKIAIEANDQALFEELAFCTLTPQAKPKEADLTLTYLKESELLYTGDAKTLSNHLNRVRFRFNKANYLVHNRNQCQSHGHFILRSLLNKHDTPESQRKWLVATMKGIGWKEASHFLRNTGLGLNLAILDRHILRSLGNKFNLPLPKSINQSIYLQWENLLRQWAVRLDIPFPALDFVIFYHKTGLIFK